MKEIFLFTDGSVNTQTKNGVGAYLILKPPISDILNLERKIITNVFQNTSSTKLELETLLWALSKINPLEYKIVCYTDSQNIIGLPGRREYFEQHNYCTRNNSLINNHVLYKQFYEAIAPFDIEFRKIKGHQPQNYKDSIDKIFSLVDKAARKNLRKL